MSRRMEYKDGTVRYYNSSNELHREDGPAVEWNDGSKFWYINEQLHREDGPALEDADGIKYWYINGQLHREDGPAIEHADGSKYWYINGRFIRNNTTNHFVKLSQLSLRSILIRTEIFNYNEIERPITEELGMSIYNNYRELVNAI